MRKSMKYIAFATMVTMGLLLCPTTQAVQVLTFTAPHSPGVQQTLNNPMIMGHAAVNQPPGFAYTDIGGGGGGLDHTENSPTYTVAQMRGIVGNLFDVAVDFNQNGPASTATQFLYSFNMTVNGTAEFAFDGGTSGAPMNISANGTGYSDGIISTFDLSTFADTDVVVFNAHWYDTDGFEQFFLSDLPDRPVIPEPATLALFGVGLSLAGLVRLRRSKK